MKKQTYDRRLIRWVKNHYWDSLEKDKDLILRHLRTFAGDDVVYDQVEDRERIQEIESDTKQRG